jgi:hypothetical protein
VHSEDLRHRLVVRIRMDRREIGVGGGGFGVDPVGLA